MSLRIICDKPCPFFEIQLTRRSLSRDVDKWDVGLDVDTNIGWIVFSGFSIKSEAVLVETGPEGTVKGFVHKEVENLWDPRWWHTKFCRGCPLTTKRAPEYLEPELEEGEETDSHRGRSNSGFDSDSEDPEEYFENPNPFYPGGTLNNGNDIRNLRDPLLGLDPFEPLCLLHCHFCPFNWCARLSKFDEDPDTRWYILYTGYQTGLWVESLWAVDAEAASYWWKPCQTEPAGAVTIPRGWICNASSMHHETCWKCRKVSPCCPPEPDPAEEDWNPLYQ